MRFEVLGPVRVAESGRELGPVSELRRRLLALLLVRANRAVGVEVLCEALWGDDPPRRPVNSLQLHVHRLRQVLPGSDRLLRVPGGYLLEVGPAELDAWEFARLHARARQLVEAGDLDDAVTGFREALGLWRGDAYADVEQGDFVGPEARRLAEARVIACEELFDAELDRGSTREIVPELTEKVAEFPLRERFTGQLMLALYRSGRQARALTAYRAAVRRLGRELRTEPGLELRRLYEAIRAGDQDLHTPDGNRASRRAGREPADGGQSPVAGAGDQAPGAPESGLVQAGQVDRAAARPAQLPPAPGAFVGRERELEQLDEAALDGGLVMITGMAGVGKTALAVRYAHQVAERFGDGQLYLDLRGHAPEPALNPTEALGHLLRGLEADPNRDWKSTDEASAEFRSLLSGRKMLVLLDNAASADQVRPLLPGAPDCLTLVTSRNRLSGLIAREGAQRIALGLLSPVDADALLTRLLGSGRVRAESERTAELIEICAGLPLALRITGAQLADEPHRTFGDYLSEFRDRGLSHLEVDDDEHFAVATAFDLSYQRLTPTASRLFRLLGFVPGLDFTVDAAAAAGGMTVANARHTLRRLVSAHLLYEHVAGRYRFHDLVRDYARHRAETEEAAAVLSEAVEGLFAWYYQGIRAARERMSDRRQEPPSPELPEYVPQVVFTGGQEATSWLTAEIHNIAAAVMAAAGSALTPWSWHLTSGLAGMMIDRGYQAEVLVMARTAADAARAAGDRTALAYSLTELGAAQHMAGMPVSDTLLAEALDYAESVGDKALHGFCLNLAGVASLQKSKLDLAEEYLTRALTVYRDAEDSGGQSLTLNNLAAVSYQRGALARAARFWEEDLALQGDIVTMGTPTTLSNMVWLRIRLGQLDGIDELIARAADMGTKVGDQGMAAQLAINRSDLYRELGRYDDAFEWAATACRLADELTKPNFQAPARTALGQCYLAQGDPKAARVEFERAAEYASADTLRDFRSDALRELAETEMAVAGLASASEAHALEALEFARGTDRVLEAHALVTLARVALALGRPQDAALRGEDALRMQAEIGHLLGQARAHRVLGEAYRATGEEASRLRSVQHLREALRMFEAFGSPEAAEVDKLLQA